MTGPATAPLAAGEFGFDRSDFAFIATTLHEDAGIHLPASKANLVYSRLAKRLRALGLESFRDYCALVGSEEGADERAQMVAALTTNVTRFFREPHHFEHLRRKLTLEEAAIAKLFTTEEQTKVLDELLQLYGGYGYMMEYNITRAYVDTRVARIYGGTSEVMKELISRNL